MRRGIALIEVVLVVMIVLILGAVVIVAINPSERLREACEKDPTLGHCQEKTEERRPSRGN